MGWTGFLARWIPGSPPSIKSAAQIRPQPSDPYFAPDLLPAICLHIALHDLSNKAVQDLLYIKA